MQSDGKSRRNKGERADLLLEKLRRWQKEDNSREKEKRVFF